jgi:hypothetical protein
MTWLKFLFDFSGSGGGSSADFCAIDKNEIKMRTGSNRFFVMAVCQVKNNHSKTLPENKASSDGLRRSVEANATQFVD